LLQLSVHVGIVRSIERKEGYGMLARQLSKDVVAADLSAGIRRDQAASFYP